MIIPGRVENQHSILEMESMSVKEIPFGWIKEAMGSLAQCYKGYGYKTYVLNPVASVRWVWNIVKTFLDERVKNKVIFC